MEELEVPNSFGKDTTGNNHLRLTVCVDVLSCGRLFVTLWTVACQVPLSMEFSRQEYWSGLPFPSPQS